MNRIETIRKQKGITREALAHSTGLTFSTIQRACTVKNIGKMEITSLQKFARALGVEMGELVEPLDGAV